MTVPEYDLLDEDKCILNFLLDRLIPPSEERHLPGGAGVEFMSYLATAKQIGWARENLARLRTESNDAFGKEFSFLSASDCTLLVDRLAKGDMRRFFDQLGKHLVQCYYRNERVLQALGVAVRPPFPEGHFVEEGDICLLEPVALRGKIYRDV